MEKMSVDRENKLYKVHNLRESLYKLDELFNAFGLDINYNFSIEQAYININGKSHKMKRGNNCFYIKLGSKLIAFSFSKTNLMFNYGTIMDVIVACGKDIKYLEYCQGKSFDNFEHPYTIYVSYVDGKLNQFYSDNRYIEFTKGNTINFKVAELIKDWELDYNHSFFERPYYHEFGCGTKEEEVSDYGKIYLPTASLDLVDKMKGRKRAVIADHIECLYEDYTYHLKHHKNMNNTSRLAFYDKFGGKTLVDPNLPDNIAKYPDSKCMDFVMNVMSIDEAKEVYDAVVKELKRDSAYQYIDSYFGELIESVKAYQNQEKEDEYQNSPIHFLEFKNK